ncbi:hypothetical protein [Streptomyces otsuchiensis]|uniref:hypothetical protein n=1 Tax=Streptomyces otsuchiensis TaxID=2681388 RepID=UPI001030F362|nr:hypothetical protein [Streptomyces otsuchiensis]
MARFTPSELPVLTVRPPRGTEVTRAAARALATGGRGQLGGVLDITVLPGRADGPALDRALAHAERHAAERAVTAALRDGTPRSVRLRVPVPP